MTPSMMGQDDDMPDNVFGRRIADVLQALVAASLIGGAVFVRDLAVEQTRLSQQTIALSATVTHLAELNKTVTERITIGGFNADQGRALTFRVEQLEGRLAAHEALPGHAGTDKRLAVLQAKLDEYLREIEKAPRQ